MTNTLNRRAGLSFLEKQIKLTDRKHSSLTVCFIDANGLKNVNDVYGHLEGDDYIIRTSQMLKETIRESDSIIRIGGDEFLLVLPDCTLDEAKIIWERFLKKIDEFNSLNMKPYQMSLSHGCEEYNENNKLSIERLLALADEKMYEDKRK